MRPEFVKRKVMSLVAPSFGANTSPYKERLEVAIKNLENEGFVLYKGPNINKGEGIVASASKEDRAKEINEAFLSDSEVISSVGGGETMVEMLEGVDFEIIKNNPKWYMGFSDNTNLTYTIATICDIETIYGICAPSFAYKPFKYDTLDALRLLYGEKVIKSYKSFVLNDEDESPIHPYHFDKRTKMINYGFTKAKGRIIGGCLDCLLSLCGTKFDNTVNYMKKHKDEGIIFFLEACDLNSIQLRRGLIQLKYAGWFDNVDAFIIGRSNNYYSQEFGISMTDTYRDILQELNKPFILDVSLGHIPPSVPIRVGALCEVTLDNDTLTFTYED